MNSFVSQAFSNTGRRYKVAFSLAIVALLCFWSQQNAPLPTLTDCLADPLACDGKLLSTNAGGKVESVEAWGFWLRNGGQRVRVTGNASDVHAGDTVFLEAVFHKEGYLAACRRELHLVVKAARIRPWTTRYGHQSLFSDKLLELYNSYVSRYRSWRILVSLPALLYVLVVVLSSSSLGGRKG